MDICALISYIKLYCSRRLKKEIIYTVLPQVYKARYKNVSVSFNLNLCMTDEKRFVTVLAAD